MKIKNLRSIEKYMNKVDFHLLRTRGCLLLNMKPYIAKAGVRGQIVGLVGSFYECGKKGKPKSHIKIYELQIDELFKKWPDKKRRERRWVHIYMVDQLQSPDASEI